MGDGLVDGQQLGKFRLECPLGSGRSVWRAHDTDLDRSVALKVLRIELANDDDARLRLAREVRALGRLRHPNVVAIYEIATIDDYDVIVMELSDGETLTSWLSRRPRGPIDVLDVVTAAGRGLVAAHEAGMIHRNFTPDSVLIERSGRVLVTDFGFPTVGELMVGSSYLAPEQRRGEPADARSDQFAFCATLWQALAGEAGPCPTIAIPDPIQVVLRRGLSLSPAERWSSMDEVLGLLSQARAAKSRASVATHPKPDLAEARIHAPARARRRELLYVALGVSILWAFGAVYWAVRQATTPSKIVEVRRDAFPRPTPRTYQSQSGGRMAIAHSGPVTGEPCQTDCSLAFASGRQAMVPPSDQALAPRTMEAWVKPTRDPWGWTPIVTRRPVWGLYLMASKESSAVLCFTDQGPPITSTSTVLADTWTHVACTDDGRHTRIYINGTEVLDKSHPARKQDPRVSVVDTPIEIGYDNNGRAHFAGAIAEVRLWDTVRTEDDISNSMERRLPGTEAGLVGYWPLDEAKGQTIRDLSKTFRRGWLGVTPNADDPADAVWIEGRPF